MKDKILVPAWILNIMDSILEKEKPVRFLDLLKHANANRNKQVHRMTSDSKRGRQFLHDKNKFITGQGKPIDTKSTDAERRIIYDEYKPEPREPNSKTDI